jgi:rhodanese-related sulfurtransferase
MNAPETAPQNLTPEQVQALLQRDKKAVLVDVLPAAEHERCHVRGARNACVYEVAFADNMRGLAPDSAQTVVVCGHGAETREAEFAVEKLERLGYTDVRILAGGRVAWHAAGLPLAGDEPTPTAPAGVAEPAPGRYEADPAASWIRWEGRNPNGAHDGTVDLAGGAIEVTAEGVTGRFEIDLETLRNADLAGDPTQQVLVDHLLSDDFFFAEKFPRPVFTIASAAPVPEAAPTTPNYRIDGALELRGVRAPLAFDATISSLAEGGFAVEAHFDLDRTRWGVIYGSARFLAHLGMHVVFDPVSIRLRVVLR